MSNQIKKILIIRFRRIGDAVISSVLCSSLKKSFPQAEIHYVLNEGIDSLFENHPDIDKLITFSEADQKSLFPYVGKIRKIMREGKYDIIIDTRSTIKTLWFSLFSLGTKYRIGRKKSYNFLIQNYRMPSACSDEVSNTLKLLEPLQEKYNIQYVREFKLYVLDEEKKIFAEKMESCGIDFSKPVMTCAVTARLVYKVWKKEKMIEILRRVLSQYPSIQLVLINAGKREKQNAEEIYEKLGRDSHIFFNLNAESLRELLALFSYTSFFFGNEGGPRHISQAMDIPSFAIFPPKSAKQIWLPNSTEKIQGIELKDINPDAAQNDALTFEQKLDLIDIESVWDKLDKMLKKNLNIS